jgi:oligopeptide/dipeptide ABC transporter ATP-binding protein
MSDSIAQQVADEPPLLKVEGLELDLVLEQGTVRAVDDLSLHIRRGETLCLVGESGCGKTLTALAIGRLAPEPPARYVSGRILLDGRDMLRLGRSELRATRGKVVSYVFQEPAASLNPVLRIGTQIQEVLRLHCPEKAGNDEVARWLKLVGIAAPEQRARAYPHELSGGMQQRAMIALALAAHPRLLIADEPTTALDVTVQAQIMDLLQDLQRQLGMSLLLITHNLHLAAGVADCIAVMYAGQIVEEGPAAELLHHPLHPYTRALIRAVPTLGAKQERLAAIPGQVPSPGSFPSGCRFHPRCGHARKNCADCPVDLLGTVANHSVRCHYWNAPPPTADEALNPSLVS